MTRNDVLNNVVSNLIAPEIAPEIAIFDARVDDLDRLMAGLLPGVETIALHPDENWVTQVTAALGDRRWAAVHLFGHGSPGRMQLGNGELSAANLDTVAAQVAAWSVEELRLYGCRVAAGAGGQALLARLARLTGATVAGATSLLGAAGWTLDAIAGAALRGVLPIAPEVATSYGGTLAEVVVNATNDEVADTDGKKSLREAIAAASAGDTITFDPSIFTAENTEIALSSQLGITKNVTIKGDVDGDGDGDVTLKGKPVQINAGVTANLSGLTITGSTNSGMLNNGTATLTNVIFSGNNQSAGAGGGMGNTGTATLANVTFSGNNSNGGGRRHGQLWHRYSH